MLDFIYTRFHSCSILFMPRFYSSSMILFMLNSRMLDFIYCLIFQAYLDHAETSHPNLVVMAALCGFATLVELRTIGSGIATERPVNLNILHNAPFFQNGAKSGFEMCFGLSTLGAGAKTRLESRIKEFTPHRLLISCVPRWRNIDLGRVPYVLYGLNILTWHPLPQRTGESNTHDNTARLRGFKMVPNTITIWDMFCAKQFQKVQNTFFESRACKKAKSQYIHEWFFLFFFLSFFFSVFGIWMGSQAAARHIPRRVAVPLLYNGPALCPVCGLVRHECYPARQQLAVVRGCRADAAEPVQWTINYRFYFTY